MERIVLEKFDSSKSSINPINYLLYDKAIDGGSTLNNGNFDVLFNSLNENEKIDLVIKNNARVRLSFFAKTELKNLEINIDVYGNSELEIYFADFAYGMNEVNVKINLKEPRSRVNWHLASLTSKQDKKVFNVSVVHEAKNTYAKVDNYGVCKDTGKLLFAGVSHILNKSIESETYQNAKIMVFDKECIATAKPILKIDENDIIANHAAVVGKVNDEHLFYLTSRGLSESQAKEIITFGYLKPILEGFVEDNIKEEITSLIEGRM